MWNASRNQNRSNSISGSHQWLRHNWTTPVKVHTWMTSASLFCHPQKSLPPSSRKPERSPVLKKPGLNSINWKWEEMSNANLRLLPQHRSGQQRQHQQRPRTYRLLYETSRCLYNPRPQMGYAYKTHHESCLSQTLHAHNPSPVLYRPKRPPLYLYKLHSSDSGILFSTLASRPNSPTRARNRAFTEKSVQNYDRVRWLFRLHLRLPNST